MQFAHVLNDQLVFLQGENSKTVYGGICDFNFTLIGVNVAFR